MAAPATAPGNTMPSTDPEDPTRTGPDERGGGRLRRAVAIPVWRLVRPVARPVLWRVRGFLAADAVRELAALRAAQEEMHQATREAAREAVQDALRGAGPASPSAHAPPRMEPYGGPAPALCLGDTAAERWLLTVALLDGAAQPA